MAVCRYVRHKTNAELGRPKRTGLDIVHVCTSTQEVFCPFPFGDFFGKSIVHILDM